MTNNYDAVARFYDALSKLIFGNALIKAQRFLVQNISAETNVLIIGGGTGWILEEIAAVHSASLNITYVEISAKMMRLSKQRNVGQNKVDFVLADIEDHSIYQQYDVILTPFLFDNFNKQRVGFIFKQLHLSLKPVGLWLFCDFQVQENYKSIWQKIILQMMYWFFGWFCDLESRKLISMNTYFDQENYRRLTAKTFYNGFIISQIYQKQTEI